jgi:hypothetical protein
MLLSARIVRAAASVGQTAARSTGITGIIHDFWRQTRPPGTHNFLTQRQKRPKYLTANGLDALRFRNVTSIISNRNQHP